LRNGCLFQHEERTSLKIIAHIETDFSEKFGIPRQSGIVEELKGKIIFAPEYRNPDAVRGLEEFSHIWILWQFSKAEQEHWSATVRPPRLGGKKRVGVFATRSPFRPNNIGLSSVQLERVEFSEQLGPVLHVAGIDLLDGTPIYDIKPYIPYADCHLEATEGYTKETKEHELTVNFPYHLLAKFPPEKQEAIVGVLKQDPRPAYCMDASRIYGVTFAGYNVKFTVDDVGMCLTVCDVEMQV